MADAISEGKLAPMKGEEHDITYQHTKVIPVGQMLPQDIHSGVPQASAFSPYLPGRKGRVERWLIKGTLNPPHHRCERRFMPHSWLTSLYLWQKRFFFFNNGCQLHLVLQRACYKVKNKLSKDVLNQPMGKHIHLHIQL